MFGITWPTIESLISKGLAMLGVWVVQRYGLTDGTWQSISGIIMSILGLLWSIKSNTPTAIVKKAENLSTTTGIQSTDKGIVDATGPKVTKA